MLTSSNQYLRPDYLSPLPTTLDAKKSPLALLAQTCSAIGADTPNPKLISAAEKASKKYEDKSPVIHVPDNKPSFKPYESCLTAREKTKTPEDRASVNAHSKTPSSKGSASTTPVQARCSSNQSSSSQRTPPPAHRKTPSEKSDERSSPMHGSPAPAKSNSDSTGRSSASKLPFTPTSLSSSADTKESSSFKPSVPVSSSAFFGGLPPTGFPLPMDLMTSSLMAAQHHALKNGLNPYLAYARMKAPGSDLGICRDPYCTGCSLSSHLLKSAVCPAGCAQCDHAKTPFSLPTNHPAAAAYAHAQLAALAAASQLPFVCSWMAGDSAYCGKRFATSDELLQHLRSHTASGESSPSLSMLSATHPLLQRTYPTPPLSPLTPRFHPYSKPSHMVSSPPLPFPLPPHPSLAAYFPSYPLFGPRPLHPLDAKKSPLALLAQTCSAIGADTPNPKLISAAEKASKKYEDKSPVIHVPDNKPSFKPYESCLTAREKTKTPEDRASVNAHSKTPSSKGSASTTPVQARCSSNQSSSSQRTPPPAHRKTPSEKSDERSSPMHGSPAPAKSNSDSTGRSSASKLPFTPTSLSSSADTKESSSFKPSVPVSSSAFFGGLPPTGFPLPMDLMTSSLMAAQHHALKNGLNPYLAYARMKAPGSDLGICRDPYCTGCSLSSHLLKSAVCPAGCAQCDHAKTPFSLPTNHPAAAAYAHAQLAALAAASQLPFVCSWMAGDSAYCGKRFATSDELLQHLRSHTASGESSPSLSMLSATHPLLQRTYPTPPLSPLTPRFHPYSKPSHMVSSPPLPFPLPPHPSLAAYFPSYPLFGPRPLHP